MAIDRITGFSIDETLRIPEVDNFKEWKQVPIVESGQPLVSLDRLFHPGEVTFSPAYFRDDLEGSIEEMFLREEVAERLKVAASFLPVDYSFILFDAYRPLSVQQELFNTFMEVLKEEQPGLSPEELIAATQRYVSLPSDDPDRPSPHYTGASIDLSILDPDGRELDMGTKFDSFDEASKTAFFQGSVGGDPREFHRNRLLLYGVMSKAGFTNYPEEWWHFDYGNQFWGKCSGQPAIFSGIELIQVDETNK